jgi:hypothetical protein
VFSGHDHVPQLGGLDSQGLGFAQSAVLLAPKGMAATQKLRPRLFKISSLFFSDAACLYRINEASAGPQKVVSMPNMMLENDSEPSPAHHLTDNQFSFHRPDTYSEHRHLFPQERGAAKQREWQQAVQQRRQEEEAARIPHAHPLPFSLDVPQVRLGKKPST